MKIFDFSDLHPGSKLVLTIPVMVLSLIVFYIIGLLIAIPVFGLGASEVLTIMSGKTEPGQLYILKYSQIISSIGLFILPAILLGYIYSAPGQQYIPYKNPPSTPVIILITLAVVLAVPLINYTVKLNSAIQFPEFLSSLEESFIRFEEKAMLLMEKLLSAQSIPQLMLNLFMIAVIPALGEELIFRGIIQKSLIDLFKTPWLGILISAILFSAIHMQFYGFFPRMLLGIYFGYLLFWSNNIWLPIVAHFINNALAVIMYYLYENGIIAFSGDEIGQDGYFSALASLVSFSIITFIAHLLIKKKSFK